MPVVQTINPTDQDVARAKYDVKRDQEDHIREIMPVLTHLAAKRPRKSTPKSNKGTRRKI